MKNQLLPESQSKQPKAARRELKWGPLVLSFFPQQIVGLNLLDSNVRRVVATTAPLNVSVAIIYVLFVRGKIRSGVQFFLASCFCLFVATQIGNAVGFPHVDLPASAGAPHVFLVNLLGGYFSAYGAVMFLFALVVGVFLGRMYIDWIAE
jgi:hypothetical protein